MPGAQPQAPFGGLVGQLSITQSWFCESRALARPALVFLIWVFFCPLSWDTTGRSMRPLIRGHIDLPVLSLGHLTFWPLRQESRVDPVDVDATRTALAGDVPRDR